MRYYWMPRDEVLGRITGLRERQVWQPRTGHWVPYDFDEHTECTGVSVEEARQHVQRAATDAGGLPGPSPFDTTAPEPRPIRLPRLEDLDSGVHELAATHDYVDRRTGEPVHQSGEFPPTPDLE
jgi:hypothetical protein